MTDVVANIGISLQQRAQSDARRVSAVLIAGGGAS
jgi:hypothetical protein